MDFSGISNESFLGKVLRAPLRLIPQSAVFPILQGPLRGKKWIVGSGVHGCWLGSYEHEKQLALQRAIRSGDVVYDIGANVGFYTLLSCVLTGDRGHVFAFEPLPGNVRYLREHLAINHIPNCTVIEAAVAGQDGEARFAPAVSRSEGRLSATGEIVVRTIALDSAIASGEIKPPAVMKIDIEGAEVECLRGAKNTIRNFRPTIFLATHSRELNAACLAMLAARNYRVRAIDGRAIEDSSELLAEPI
jgi:FkbM family methyltransferase